MKVLVVGATGLIGSAIVARLVAEGHEIIAAARRPNAIDVTAACWVRLDLGDIAKHQDWTAILNDVDAVVNCAGALQDGPSDSVARVHSMGPSALFEACERSRVRRVIHFSAAGVDRETPTEFSRTKLAGDEALMARDLDWVILRPSVVVGRAAYGGSALLRGFASLSVVPVMPDTAPLQIVHLDDVVQAVIFFLQKQAPTRVSVELVGPKAYRFEEAVALLRRWLRWPRAHTLAVPTWVAGLAYRVGDIFAHFGWRPPVRTTAQREMVRGATGDASQLTRLSGITPRSIEDALRLEPASVQERWFARLYVLKPLIFTVFSLFWIITGIVSLGPGRERGVQLVMDGGTSETVALLATLSGGTADIVIGLLITFRRTARLGLHAAFCISIAYAIIGTILVPWLWFDPLGPMLKIAPVMVFNLVALAVLDER